MTESLKDKLKACVGKKKQPDAIREVDSPEGRGALVAVNARETFPDAGIARHLRSWAMDWHSGFETQT